MSASELLRDCDTLMLDMDGTLLDLAFDNFMWLQHIPLEYARKHGLEHEVATQQLHATFRSLQGQLAWYCLDHWSERLDLDVLALHRAERARIGWLPGAMEFLQSVQQSGPRVLMVTNSHPDTLAVKSEVTGIEKYFAGVYTSHQFGYPKEDQRFWQALAAAEGFDPQRTMFVDDTETVLASAREYGVKHVVRITRPDTSAAVRDGGAYVSVEGVAELLPA
ncbi:MAG: GMP/IMP nucleotidase [Woeseia sp.]